ncbi:MAG TPA: GNAT family N-acetyltransferase [Magnetospirillum sp.]|jgi:predicted GNAT family acetyltransferase|nr:GNAT family N-acetyltransferase [Magnetospirillum sp.]
MGAAADPAIRDNPTLGRYELEIDGQVVFLTYRRQGDTLAIPHVEAPPALRGTGAAGRLMEGVMRIARDENLKVVPICGYAAAWLRRHREWHDLVGSRR